MKPSAENIRLAKEIHCRLELLRVPSTVLVRAIRREFSSRIASTAPEGVLQLALHWLSQSSDLLRFFSYELVSHHGPALSFCYLKPPKRGGLILGYGGANLHQIRDGISKLRMSILSAR
jgi:GntR family transcriptional regulator / MocR family aminotransferase